MNTPILSPEQLQSGVMLRHYKGGLYKVSGICRIEASLKPGVLYKACQGDEDVTWMRPMAEFLEIVTTAEGRMPRFSLVNQAP